MKFAVHIEHFVTSSNADQEVLVPRNVHYFQAMGN